jgi:hypothetical protein
MLLIVMTDFGATDIADDGAVLAESPITTKLTARKALIGIFTIISPNVAAGRPQVLCHCEYRSMAWEMTTPVRIFA